MQESLPDTVEKWHGYRSYAFDVAGVACTLVAPKTYAKGKPWIWRARFFGHEPQVDLALLEAGFHLAYCEVGGLFGSPKAVQRWDDFYAFAIGCLGLSKTVVLEGMSRGGLICFNWAAANLDKLSCIYVDAPVCDITSWPGGKGEGVGSPDEWRECLAAYGFASEADARAYDGNPLDHAETLAKAEIPVMVVYGKDDVVVPPSENCLRFEERFRNAGGEIVMIGKDDCGHHPHCLPDPKPIVDFILQHARPKGRVESTMPPAIEPRRGLANSLAVFSAEPTARVAFLGGSITEMEGWRNHVAASLQKRFPKTTFDFVYAGIGSTDSTMGAFRLETDAFMNGKVDLLFIESAVNELHNFRNEDEIRRAVEGIIRRAYAHNPVIDIVAQYFYDPAYLKVLATGTVPWQIQTLDALSDYYGIPSINQVVYFAEALETGAITQDEFGDCHPKPPGHALYAKVIDELFDHAWSASTSIEPHRLPEPIRADNYERGRYLDVQKAVLGDGWRYVDDWHPTEGKTRKQFVELPVIETKTPGSELFLEFTGTAIGIVIPAGPDVGIVEFSVDGSPFKRQDLFTGWSRGLHIPWIYVLESSLPPGAHSLRLRMAEDANSESKGNACRICWFAVNSA